MVIDYVALVNLALSVIVPVGIQAIKVFAPRIPKSVYPWAAPVLGAGLAVLGNYLGVPGANGVLGAVAGAIGVWGREALDQLNKLAAPPAPPAQ